MNFDDAITAHAEWKTRLLRYIENPNGSLVSAAIEDHKACKLGCWIHGPATKYSYLPDYEQLLADHAVFHKQAALIVAKLNNGELVTPYDITHPDSPYVIASRNVVAAILVIKRKIGNVTLDAAAPPAPSTGPLHHETAPAFLKISSASPEITQIIQDNATKTAAEVATLLKAYGDQSLSPALIEIIRESLLIANANMFLQILDETKKGISKPPKT